MCRVTAAAALVLLAGAPACAWPSHFGVASAYPAYGPAPYAVVPRRCAGGGHHHHATPRHHRHWGGHGAPLHSHHRPHDQHHNHHRH